MLKLLCCFKDGKAVFYYLWKNFNIEMTALWNKKSRAISAMDSKKVFELYKDRSRKAITSGNLTLVPDESFFTSYLLKVLKENEQLILPASSLFSRIYEPVLNNSPTVPQFGVIQQAGDEGGDFLFIQDPNKK